MTTPMFSVTGDDSRYYEWPERPGIHLPSITTVKKQGVPSPAILPWAIKQVALTAIDNIEKLHALKGRANG